MRAFGRDMQAHHTLIAAIPLATDQLPCSERIDQAARRPLLQRQAHGEFGDGNSGDLPPMTSSTRNCEPDTPVVHLTRASCCRADPTTVHRSRSGCSTQTVRRSAAMLARSAACADEWTGKRATQLHAARTRLTRVARDAHVARFGNSVNLEG